MHYFKRNRKLPDGSIQTSEEYYVRFTFQGKTTFRSTGYSSLTDAKRFGANLKKSLQEGRTEAVAGSLLRRPVGSVSLGQICDSFEQAPGEWTRQTRRGYIGGLKHLVETALGPTPEWRSRPVSILTGDLVYNFKRAVAAQKVDDAARTRAYRSGNTVLRSARALFSPGLLEHYKLASDFSLPDLTGFRDAVGFKGVQKDDYRQPDDDLVRSTLSELEATRESHPDRYVAIWLALGFGLRKSEAAAVKAGWFIRLGGRVHLEVRAVVEPCRPAQISTATKNGGVCPRIPVANDAWRRLEPFISKLRPEEFVVAPGATLNYRGDLLFEDISNWLRGLGWETDKLFHEFRALAGCWVAQTDGLLVARDWLRHASVTTTEKHYGRYVRTSVTDQPAAVLATTPATTPATSESANPATNPATILATREGGSQTKPNEAKDSANSGDLPLQVIQFPAVTAVTTCGASVAQ